MPLPWSLMANICGKFPSAAASAEQLTEHSNAHSRLA